ncbi:hypothetical protein [Bacteroides stercorirosoris]|uniref:hypothetical protein n=1 Tax=Bacteroides stercorirosoris TaxID=871324 RepID=UPI003522675A
MSQKHYFKGLFIAVLGIMTFSCNDSDEETYAPQTYNVSGKVEKGPFVSGATITMQPMNANMQASGETYISTIQDNTGNFTFGSKLFDAPFAELTASGYFFNEVSGNLSIGTLNLRGIVDLSDKSTINVNILTHLKYQRVLNLVTQGNKFKDANEQAQKELFTAFGLSEYAGTDASLFSITGGNNEAAALIAVSSLLLVDRSEAGLTEYLAKLCREFGENGGFSQATKKQIKEDRDKLAAQLSNIQSNIVNRYKDLGLTVEVKNLAHFFDWDDDGVAGNETLQEGEEITIETTLIEIPNTGGSYRVKITSPVPVYLEPVVHENDGPVDVINPDQFFQELYKDVPNQNMSVEKRLEGNMLIIDVAPLNNRTEKTLTVCIYDCLGNILGTIDLVQAGNKDIAVPLLGKDAKDIVNGMAETIVKAFSEYSLLEQYYHYNKQADLVRQYIYPSCGTVSNCWSAFYKFNQINLAFKNADTKQLNVYQDILNVFSAMQYYYMITIWGDVPYITDYEWGQNGYYSIARTSATTILNNLKDNLIQSIEVLDDKKNESLKDEDGLFFMSKDVARLLLADIYMYQHDYRSAMSFLDDIIKNGFYELDESNFNEKGTIENILNNKGGKEILFALYHDKGTRSRSTITIQTSPVIPLQTYTDVVLSYAECLYKQGNILEAKKRLNDVISAKNITIANDNDVLAGIAEARKQLLLYSTSNFAFMKRNGFAQDEWGIEDYRLLLPIPQDEVSKNPEMTQNQGY